MTGIRVFEATREDAESVVLDLSEQTAAELAVAGVSPAALLDRVSGAPMFVSVTESGKPLSAFGFIDFGDYLSMWTLVTRAYFEMGAPAVLRTRKFLRKLDFGKPLMSVTSAPHEDTDRWLTILGFEKVGQEGNLRTFRYRR